MRARSISLAVALGGLLLGSVTAPHAQSCIDYSDGPQNIGRFDTDFCVGVADGNIFYGFHGTGLTVLDVTDPLSPTFISETATPNACLSQARLNGDILWALFADQTLRAFDVSVPASPIQLGFTPLPDTGGEIAFAPGRLVLIIDNDAFLYDISNPGTPMLLDTVGHSARLRTVVTKGDIVYLSFNGFFTSARVEKYVVSGSAFVHASTFDLGWDSSRSVDDSQIVGDRLFVSSVANTPDCTLVMPIVAIDISSPFVESFAGEIAYAEGHLNPPPMMSGNGRLYVFDRERLNIIDPITLTVVGQVPASPETWMAPTTTHIITRDDVIALNGGVSPAPLSSVSELAVFGLDVITRDDFAYSLGTPEFDSVCEDWRSRLYAFDASDPVAMTLEQEWSLTDGIAMFADDTRLYTVDRASEFIVSVHNFAAHPAPVIGEYRTSAAITAGAAGGTYVYLALAGAASSLRVIDVSDPADIVDVIDVPLGAEVVHAITIVDDHLYVGSRVDVGATIVDVSDPTQPVVVGSHPYSAFGQVVGDIMYTEGAELRILDVTNPSVPIASPAVDADVIGVRGRVAIDDDVLYWSTEYRGTAALDRSTLEVFEGRLPVGGATVTINDALLVYADSELRAYPPSCLPVVVVEPGTVSPARHGFAAPNPFQTHTTLTFDVRSESGAAVVTVTDVGGRLVRRLRVSDTAADRATVNWDGTDRHGRPVVPGVYFYSLGDRVPQQRIVRIR